MWPSFVIAILSSCLAGSALAQERGTVGHMLPNCRLALTFQHARDVSSVEALEGGICLGVALGLGAALGSNCSSIERGYTPAPEVAAAFPPSVGASVQAFVDWADNHPKRWDDDFVFGMQKAIMEVFPCSAL